MGLVQNLKKLFGIGNGPDMRQIIAAGAKIVDVRTPGEYAGGHVKGSVNIPLSVLPQRIGSLKKDQVIVTCCASGMRSRSAKSILQSNGFTQVHNGGSWMSVARYKR